MRRLWIGLAMFIAVFCAAGAAYVYLPGSGLPLNDGDRMQLLRRASLPVDFPIHPAARRMSQAPQGGVSYQVGVPVPDAATWVRDSLMRSGYAVSSSDLEGDDEAEYQPRWLYYQHRAGASGAVIVRQIGRRFNAATEIKILSQQDDRLKPLPVAPGALIPTRAP
ncbi:MAG TPA: hypothetical protein VNM48_07645 [Chloroflexota bacterium]|nr:hypothetical protein [Chloroflexota bacterium]